MKKIAFFDSKPYDELHFNEIKDNYDFQIKYFESKLNEDSAYLAKGYDAVCAFVNDKIDAACIEKLEDLGIGVIGLRCAGYNNVDFKRCYKKIHVLRVPAYSPYAVAEHAMALVLTLIRKTHMAYIRTRDLNFSLNGLLGFDLHGKTAGVVGTGKIGRVFADICRGFGMNVIAYDLYPAKDSGIEYVSFDELCKRSDIISLHCPLTEQTKHLINKESIAKMKDNVMVINTSRGKLIDTKDLLDAIRDKKVGAAGLDVYEEESDLFFEDFSDAIVSDDLLLSLISMPNVIVTSHQAFFTKEALSNIAKTTLDNFKDYFAGAELKNEICYQCVLNGKCQKENGRCF